MSGIFDGDLVNAYRVSSSDFLKAKESDFLDIFKRWSIFEHVGWEGPFPIRTDITVLQADPPRQLRLGWIMRSLPGGGMMLEKPDD